MTSMYVYSLYYYVYTRVIIFEWHTFNTLETEILFTPYLFRVFFYTFCVFPLRKCNSELYFSMKE